MAAQRINFTQARLEALEPRERRYDAWDETQRRLAVTVTPAGAKTFYYVRKIKGRVERIRIGKVDEVTIEQARRRSERLGGKVAAGRNPADEKRAAQAEMTLGDLWTLYLERHAKPYKKSWKWDEYQYKKHLKTWQSRRLSEIKRQDVATMMARIGKKDGRIAANRVRALLSSMFGKAEEWGAQVSNPCRGVKRFKETARQRYLEAEELRAFLQAVEADPDPEIRDAVYWMLFTGARRENALGARWSEINLSDGLWTIPAERIKSNRTTQVPLAPCLVRMLKARRRGNRSEFVFPSPRNSRGHLYTIKGRVDRIVERAGLDNVVPKDLRTTFATWMLAGGAPMEVVAEAIGHATFGGVTAVYAKVSLDRVRPAVEKTVKRMLALLDDPGAKVVRMVG